VSLSDQLLAALALYGLPVLFGTTFIASLGIPLPDTVLLIAAGSFVQQGDLSLPWTIVLTAVAAVLGDQVGYWVGRWGSDRVEGFISRRIGGVERMQAAQAMAKKWGGPGIFFSRWLVTTLAPWLNLTSGIAKYSYARFLFWDILGDVVGVVIYLTIGDVFSDRVQSITDALGNFAWVAIGLIVAAFCAWQLVKYFRTARRARVGP
jgi:membrane-associated protein